MREVDGRRGGGGCRCRWTDGARGLSRRDRRTLAIRDKRRGINVA
jgi:hypothetical protein